MTSKKTPIAVVKEKFSDKAGLVKALQALTGDALWVARTSSSKGLAHVSNAKLLKLHATFTAVKEKFGTRDALLDAVVAAEGRSKDAPYRGRMADWPVPRIYDLYLAVTKRNAAKARAAKPAEKKTEKKADKPAAAKTPAKSVSKKTAKKA